MTALTAELLRLHDVPGERPGANPADFWPRLTAATAHLDPPLGVIDRAAFAFNAADLVRRAVTGLNRWKQHLIGGCCGKTIELDEGSDRASADAVTWRTIAPASEGA